MRLAQVFVLSTLIVGAAGVLPARAQEKAATGCTAAALTERDEALQTGAWFDYGDSLHEVGLYRLLTGIDQAPLKSEFLSIYDFGPDGISYRDAPPPKFSDLLLPAAQLENDPASYVTYYHAQDMLKQTGLRSYRPERGNVENSADWWLRDDADPVYRSDDFAGWLQAMAASDTFHRIERRAGRAYYRPLISSWTYFDPKKWDVAAYDRVTALAHEKWRRENRFIWSAVAFSRMRTDQAEADVLIDWFFGLQERLKICAATRDEAILYPLFRFHTLRLLFMRAAYLEDGTFYDKAIALLADRIANLAVGYVTSDDTAAQRAALLMAGYADNHQIFYPETAALLDGRVPQAQAWRDLRWASAGSFDEYITLSAGDVADRNELEILNGLTTEALYQLLEGRAFNGEARQKLAETGWLRSYLLGQADINRRFLAYIADNHTALSNDARALLAVGEGDRDKENLLFLLRHTDFSIQIETTSNSEGLWCYGLGTEAYKRTLGDIMGPVLRMAEIPQAERWYRINYWQEYDRYRRSAASPTFRAATTPGRWPAWLSPEHWFRPNGSRGIVDYDEIAQLGYLPQPREFLIDRVLDWAKAERSSFEKPQAFFNWNGDQRVAEALHLAIRETRRPCAGDPKRLSRAAWIVLHDNPRWQEWADKTPYWFD